MLCFICYESSPQQQQQQNLTQQSQQAQCGWSVALIPALWLTAMSPTQLFICYPIHQGTETPQQNSLW